MKKVGLIDYSIGNLFSVFQACKKVGLDPVLIDKPEEIRDVDALILPGVGAFAKGIENLNQMGLAEPIQEFIQSGKPFFGICLGMQLLFSKSFEFGETQGLNVIDGEVLSLRDDVPSDLPVPKTTWSGIHSADRSWDLSPLKNVSEGDDFYFVHSYYCRPKDSSIVLATSDYGELKYCAAVLKDNVFATQFHPEKSCKLGIEVYENWKKLYLE